MTRQFAARAWRMTARRVSTADSNSTSTKAAPAPMAVRSSRRRFASGIRPGRQVAIRRTGDEKILWTPLTPTRMRSRRISASLSPLSARRQAETVGSARLTQIMEVSFELAQGKIRYDGLPDGFEGGKMQDPALPFLVPTDGRDEAPDLDAAEGRRQPACFQEALDPLPGAGREKTFRLRDAGGEDHSRGHGLSVRDLGRLFEGVGQRMPEIELAALARFPLVGFDQGGLDGDRTSDGVLDDIPFESDESRDVPFELVEQVRVSDQRMLDDLGGAAEDLFFGERAQELEIDEDELRLGENAEDVLGA